MPTIKANIPLDVALSIIYGRTVPGLRPEQIDWALTVLTGNLYIVEVMDFQYKNAIKQARNILSGQFPLFFTSQAMEEYRRMQEDLDSGNFGKEINQQKIKEWRSKQVAHYGENLQIEGLMIVESGE